MSESKSNISFKVPQCVLDTCYEHKGIVMPDYMPKRVMDRLYTFKTRPDDTFIVTPFKSGTTWTQLLTLLSHFEGDQSKLEGDHVMSMAPFLDLVVDQDHPETSKMVIEQADEMPSPRFLKTHVISDWLPENVRAEDPKCKMIYVSRNPKDTAVSLFHYCHYVTQLPPYATWDEFIEEFQSGRMVYGSWFDNVLPWWRNKDHPNILFLKYEDMKKDIKLTIRRISTFLGKDLSEDVVDKIAHLGQFKVMKNLKFGNPDNYFDQKDFTKGKTFMRKGIVGDWKNYFTKEQNEAFDAIYEREMAGTGLEFDFVLPE